jgi:hypothetical protein
MSCRENAGDRLFRCLTIESAILRLQPQAQPRLGAAFRPDNERGSFAEITYSTYDHFLSQHDRSGCTRGGWAKIAD